MMITKTALMIMVNAMIMMINIKKSTIMIRIFIEMIVMFDTQTQGKYFNFKDYKNHFISQIEVDGRHFCDFTHRMSMGAVQYLTIEGDVRINNINFKVQL